MIATVEPSDPAVRGLVKHIKETFRTFPLADLAKMILHGRDRYQIRFKVTEGGKKLYQCQGDSSLWLSREEAVSHLLTSNAIEKFYSVEEVDIGAPSGNFNVVAVCGMSGEILGPPNHHEYQRNVARLHAERFSHMPLEHFKSRISMESDEEVIEKWKQQVSTVKHFRLKSDETAGAEEQPVKEEASAEEEMPAEPEVAEEGSIEAEDAPAEEAEESENEVASEETSAEAEAEEEGSTEEEQAEPEPAAEEPAPVEEGLVLKTPDELAMHFRKNFAGEAITEVDEATVPGNIEAKNLSRGLLEHLKQETEKLRRGFPLPMIQALCRAFEKHNLKFFKRGKKALHVSAVRPKALDESVSLSDPVKQIVEYIAANPRCLVVDMLDALASDFTKPEKKAAPAEELELSDEARVILSNLRWLASEGLILEFPDTRLVLGKTKPPAKKVAPKKEAKKGSEPEPKKEEPVKEKAEPEVAEAAESEQALEDSSSEDETKK